MHPSISVKKEQIAEACRRFGVRRLDLFGSAARGTDFDPRRSDADFFVDFVGDYGFDEIFDLTDELEKVLCLPVDVITKKGLESSSNRRIHARVMVDRQLVYHAALWASRRRTSPNGACDKSEKIVGRGIVAFA